MTTTSSIDGIRVLFDDMAKSLTRANDELIELRRDNYRLKDQLERANDLLERYDAELEKRSQMMDELLKGVGRV
jgi:septal ring factor EnvC (AmiA/AmiB activator)